MGDRLVEDWAAVRDAELAAAASVVTRFRRRRRAAVAAALGVGVAAAVSSGGLLPTTTSSLVPTDDSVTDRPRGLTQSPLPTPSADVARDDPRPGGRGSGPGYGTPGSAPGDPVDGVPSRSGRRAPFRIGVVRTKSSGHLCGGLDLISTPEVCTSARASQQKTGSVVLLYQACLRPGSALWAGAARTLRFASAKEVDFAITTADGTVIWQWSTGQRFAAVPHTLPLGEDECYEWRTRWTGLLDDGTRVTPGTYKLRVAGRDTDAVLRRVVKTFELTR